MTKGAPFFFTVYYVTKGSFLTLLCDEMKVLGCILCDERKGCFAVCCVTKGSFFTVFCVTEGKLFFFFARLLYDERKCFA